MRAAPTWRPVVWINVLSLDAPIVAVVWQAFFARNAGVRLGIAPYAILALGVWLAYSADRWLDAWRIPPGGTVLPRHRFPAEHRWSLAGAWSVLLAIAVGLAWTSLPPPTFRAGFWLVGWVGAYFAIHQCGPASRWMRGTKEIAVAALFAAGTVFFVEPRLAAGSSAFWTAVGGWYLLCFLNCYGIACWEQEPDRAQGHESLVTRWPGLRKYFSAAAGGVALAAALPVLFAPSHVLPRIHMAIAASALGLGLLDRSVSALDPDLVRLGADLALLTPLGFILLFSPK